MELPRVALFLLLLCMCVVTNVSCSSSASDAEEFVGQMYKKLQHLYGHEEKARSGEEEEVTRVQRLLAGVTPHISYGSLRADSVRCPPMSGRSYYLPNCGTATGPVNPYERGCIALTRCSRDIS